METGDKILWDSNWGFEVGTYVTDKTMYGNYSIKLLTGRVQGETICVSRASVEPYTEARHEELNIKYGTKVVTV